MPCIIHQDELEAGACTRCGRVLCERCRASPPDKPFVCNVCQPALPGGVRAASLGRVLLPLLATALLLVVLVTLIAALVNRNRALAPLFVVAFLVLGLVTLLWWVRALRRIAPKARRGAEAARWAAEFTGPVAEREAGVGTRVRRILFSPELLIGLAILLFLFVLPVLLPDYRDWLKSVGEQLQARAELLFLGVGGLLFLSQVGLLGLSQAFLHSGQYDRALRVLHIGLKFRPRSPELLSGLIDTCARRGRLDEAELAAYRLLRAAPANSASYGNLAGVLADLGRVREAEAAACRAIDLSMGSPVPYNNLAWALIVRGQQLERAVAVLELAGRLARSNEHKSMLAGTVSHAYLKLGRLPEALEQVQAALRLAPPGHRPRRAELYYGLGTIQRTAGLAAEAVDSLRQVAALDPHGRYAEPARRALWEAGAGLNAGAEPLPGGQTPR